MLTKSKQTADQKKPLKSKLTHLRILKVDKNKNSYGLFRTEMKEKKTVLSTSAVTMGFQICRVVSKGFRIYYEITCEMFFVLGGLAFAVTASIGRHWGHTGAELVRCRGQRRVMMASQA